jgi:DNA polymerase III delta prime subunit
MREFNWKLRGLVLKGRPGVGKTNTIFATAKDLGYEIYPCGNECNQIKYLK